MVGLAITIFTQGNFVGSMIVLCIATVGIVSATPRFFTATSEYLPMATATAAAGIALISSLGNLGAAVSPSLTGAVTAATGMYLVIAWYVVAGAIMLGMLKAAKSG